MQIDIDQIPWKSTQQEGISLFSIAWDRSSGDATLLIRMAPGCGYPPHRHLGEERVLVLHGSYRDEAATYPCGSFNVHPPGSSHRPVAVEGDECCVLLASICGGIQTLDP